MKQAGNTIFITGGASGIGLGLAEAFHKQGNRVILGGRRQEALDRATDANPGMEGVVMDTANLVSIRAGAAAVTKRYPDLNVVVNNAGVQRVFDFAAAIPDDTAMTEEIETNINGVVRVTAAFLDHLKAKSSATLINISSGLAFVPLARYPIYCATKAFVHSFSLSLREQLKSTGVRVVELAPPWVNTNLDARHRIAHAGMNPMPLFDFIAAAMDEIASGKDELNVAGAKFLYGAGVSDQFASMFHQMNG
jgi:uncharacterized oxidoreductase